MARTQEQIEALLSALPLRKRLRDIEEWLRANFPTTYPVVVRVEKFGRENNCHGECYYLAGKLRIRLNRCTLDNPDFDEPGELERGEMIETLLHEWAHAMVWPTVHAERHPKNKTHHEHHQGYWAAYGSIYRAFYDGTGWKRSSGY